MLESHICRLLEKELEKSWRMEKSWRRAGELEGFAVSNSIVSLRASVEIFNSSVDTCHNAKAR